MTPTILPEDREQNSNAGQHIPEEFIHWLREAEDNYSHQKSDQDAYRAGATDMYWQHCHNVENPTRLSFVKFAYNSMKRADEWEQKYNSLKEKYDADLKEACLVHEKAINYMQAQLADKQKQLEQFKIDYKRRIEQINALDRKIAAVYEIIKDDLPLDHNQKPENEYCLNTPFKEIILQRDKLHAARKDIAALTAERDAYRKALEAIADRSPFESRHFQIAKTALELYPSPKQQDKL